MMRSALSSCAVAAVLAVATPLAAAQDRFDPGAAVRFNYGWRDYGPDEGNGELDLELLRASVEGAGEHWMYSAQYRWYEDFDAVHHAWVGLRWSDDRDLRVGIQQVPFGLLPYASHSFWFGSGYYLGIEDDHDLGVVYRDARGDTDWHAGVFFGDEYGTGARFDRYSFDLATTAGLPFRERERVHARVARTAQFGDWAAEAGVSGFAGRLEDRADGGTHTHAALALHGQLDRGPLSLQAQWARYRYDVPGDRVALSAFQFPFEIAAEADVLTANVAWTFADAGWLDSVTCYNDLSTTQVRGSGLRDSWQNVTGCSFSKGAMTTYVDWIAGRNMWFVGGPGVGIEEPGGDRWRSRLNINIGFYF